MDLNYLLLWFAGSSAAISLVQYFRVGMSGMTGRKIACFFVLAAVGAGAFLMPNVGGYVASAFWVIVILVPSLAVLRMRRLVAAEEFAKSATLARWLSWITPWDDWGVVARIYTASSLTQAGSIDAAEEILERYRHLKTPQARTAVAQLYKLQKRWDEYLAWLDENVSSREIGTTPGLSLIRLRAWGETGQLDRLLAGFQAFDEHYHRIPHLRDVARIYLLTFFGRVDLLTALFDGPLASYTPAVRERWLTTARAAADRAAGPVADAGQEVFTRIEGEIVHEKRYGGAAPSALARPLVTYALIALNVLAFGVETTLGGGTDGQVLTKLGALLPAYFSFAQSWRLLAATFLHFGYLHLTMNMLALLILGPFVERILRWWRYLVCYLGAGIGSMAGVVLANHFGLLHYEMAGVVGASGSIMGLVGATAAICLRDSRVLKTRASVARLQRAGAIILIQFVFDAMTPQVSMTAHLLGAMSGFLLALILGIGA